MDQIIWEPPPRGGWSIHAAIRVTIKRGPHEGKVLFFDNGSVTGGDEDRGMLFLFERGALILPDEAPRHPQTGGPMPIKTYADLEINLH